MDDIERAVRRVAVNDNMFHIWIILGCDGQDGILHRGDVVADRRDNRYFRLHKTLPNGSAIGGIADKHPVSQNQYIHPGTQEAV